MGWVWEDDDQGSSAVDNNITAVSSSNKDTCSTRKMVSSKCRTEETEPGVFIRKCEKTETTFRDCLGRPSELVQSNKEYTEEDVSDEMTRGSFPLESSQARAFGFPGLRNDIDVIERSLLGGFNRFLEAAEEMSHEFLNVFGSAHDKDASSFPSSIRRGIPSEDSPAQVPNLKDSERDAPPKLHCSDGDVDISGLARDV